MRRLQLYKLAPKNPNQSLEKQLVLEIQKDIENFQSKNRASSLFPVTTKPKVQNLPFQYAKKQFQVNNIEQTQQNTKTPEHHSEKTSFKGLTKNNIKLRNSMTLNEHNLPPIDLTKRTQFYKKYYMDNLVKALTSTQMTYLSRLVREHFEQNIKAIHNTKFTKIQTSKKIQLPKLVTKQKTILLDLDQTLIHCSQLLNHSNVKLNIPLQNGMNIMAGVNIRPHCREFIKQLASIAQVIIFTASNALYADTIINYIDQKKYISHRLYRQHCTQEKGFYIKDLRNINRNLEDMVLVDNSLYSYCLQLENGIPILPFYDNNKDKQLLNLLEYLKELVKEKDVREMNRKFFLLDRYRQSDIKNIIINNH